MVEILIFEPWITRVQDELVTHKLTQLWNWIEFHYETPIPFAALVTCMQIDSNSHN